MNEIKINRNRWNRIENYLRIYSLFFVCQRETAPAMYEWWPTAACIRASSFTCLTEFSLIICKKLLYEYYIVIGM